MAIKHRISSCLWFDTNAEEAVNLYTSIFANSRINRTAYYSKEGNEVHGMPEGMVLTIDFELDGSSFVALNGGPIFRFNEAMSIVVNCETQEEVDHYWYKLSEGGAPEAQQCGWLKDKFGVSWQVVPTALPDMLCDADRGKADRVMAAMLKMKKLVIADLKRAYAE